MIEKHLYPLWKQPVAWVFLLALAVRFYACLATAVVNPDGLIYIQQAKAIFYGQWNEITGCQMKYLSILPPMIAAAFAVLRDWVVAARFVSLAFGFGTLIPLYFLLKRFFDQRTTALTLLVYAFIPALAGRSADVIRGPIFWFFLVCAFFMVVRHQDNRRPGWMDRDLILACIFFLLAAWARIEALLYLFVTAGYLGCAGKEKRLKALASYLAPLAVLAVAGLLAAVAMDIPLATLLRLDKPVAEFSSFAEAYRTVRARVAVLADAETGSVQEFLDHAADFVWIVPFGPLLDCLVEKFFYPYVLIFLVGFAGLRQRMKGDPRTVYFVWLCISASILLYFYTLKTWFIFDRFLNNLILPAALLVGFGIANLLGSIQRRWNFSPRVAGIVLAVVIAAFGLGKNIKPRYDEKRIFPSMAEEIIKRKAPGETVRIAAGPSNAYDWVFFYANLDVEGALCDKTLKVAIPKSYDAFVARLKQQAVRYVLWSEETWPGNRFDLMAVPYEKDFEVIGRWDYDRKDSFFLLAVKAD